MSTALLSCDRPRIVGSDFELGQFEALGPVLVLVGAWGPFFQLLAGERQLGSGRLELAGLPASAAARSGRVGLSLRDAPLPLTWTLREVLRHSAALLGHSSRRASELEADVARELGLEELLPKKLAQLSPAQQRAASIAAARLGDPAVLALEAPFVALEPAAEDYVGRVLERAVQGRSAIISVHELPGSPAADRFAQTSDELLFVARHGLVARGRHAELIAAASSYSIVVSRHAARLLSRLGEAGYDARQVTATEISTLIVLDRERRGTRPLCAASIEADAPIIELRPLWTSGDSRAALAGPKSGA